MKPKLIFLSFLTIAINNYSSDTKSLEESLSEEPWLLFVESPSFSKRPDVLCVKKSPDTPEQRFPLCSPEEAEIISAKIISSNLPKAYKECLGQILTGQNKEEQIRNTPNSISILDPKAKMHLSHFKRTGTNQH